MLTRVVVIGKRKVAWQEFRRWEPRDLSAFVRETPQGSLF
jgi:hypothetical protein